MMKAAELDRWKRYLDARNQGLGVSSACRKSRMPESTAYRFERGDPTSTGFEAASLLGVLTVDGALIQPPIPEAARQALEDFAKFRFRYFGRKSMPWQEEAANKVLEAIKTPHKEYIVMNEPPGSGKSTLFTCDIPTWLIALDRRIRIMLGSRTQTQGTMYSRRIKRALEREAPLQASAAEIEKNLAWDAEACLMEDFGAFRPPGRSEKWQDREFTVHQLDGVSLDEKEATVTAWGMDSSFLGGRYDFVIWDDLVDRSNIRTESAREEIRLLWDTQAENRLEPGGVLLLQGQRLSAMDLYRYCLDKRDDDEKPTYRHVKYPAHNEELCTGEHGLEGQDPPKPYPDGCLLDPKRLPWRELVRHQRNPRVWRTVYQQEDGQLAGGLVDVAWIKGGVDNDGEPAPGCLDENRDLREIPEHIVDTCWCFVTVDPSPSNFWACLWWAYDPATGYRYLIDIANKRMSPQDFLSMDLDTREFSGLIPTWTAAANEMGAPISHVVVEANAAQKWLISQPHVQKWMRDTGQVFVPHTTGRNKADPKFGVESIADLFKQGYIRIPWGSVAARLQFGSLVTEVTYYPDYDTDDIVMSTWFHKLAVEKHYTPRRREAFARPTPRWLANAQRGIA